ncbi:hypothetical protein V8E53_003858 [Lactarius tabidus]
MSSVSQSVPASPNFKWMLDIPLAEYKKKTGDDLIAHRDWLATELQSCESVESVLDILRGQAKAFERSGDQNQKLMNVRIEGKVAQILGKPKSPPYGSGDGEDKGKARSKIRPRDGEVAAPKIDGSNVGFQMWVASMGGKRAIISVPLAVSCTTDEAVQDCDQTIGHPDSLIPPLGFIKASHPPTLAKKVARLVAQPFFRC